MAEVIEGQRTFTVEARESDSLTVRRELRDLSVVEISQLFQPRPGVIGSPNLVTSRLVGDERDAGPIG